MAERRTLDRDGWSNLHGKIGNDKVLSNAFRLMCDATILFDAKSYASAVALATISFEEIGKHLLARWSNSDPMFSYDKRRLHVMKQCAVAALFMADSARNECKARGIDFQALKTVDAVASLAAAILTGLEKEKHFARAAMGKVMEVVKWSGLYYDQDLAAKGIEPDKITESQARSVMETLSKAFTAIADDKTAALGMFTFPYLHKTPLSPVG